MRKGRDKALESSLSALYRSEREGWRQEAAARDRDERVSACVRACEKELDAMGGAVPSHVQAARFLRAQARFVRPTTWAAFALVALGVSVCGGMSGPDFVAPQALSAAGGLLALICLVDVTRSKPFGMAELEAACPFNAVSVVLARLLLMGGASSLVLAIGACSAGAQGVGVARALLLATAPYLVACSGGLMCARRASSADARSAAITWATVVTGVAATLFYTAPSAYVATSTWIWGMACVASGAWCAREVLAWISASARGFIAEPPASVIA